MEKRVRKASELDDPLCCCEYVDRHGGRSHMAACCCDCEDLDEVCDRWVKREPQKPDSLSRAGDTVSDRLRVPWFSGAKKVDLSLIPPLILLPVFLHVAALHFLLGMAVLLALPGAVLWYYYFTHRKKGRTRFFLSLALFSLFYMYYLFLAEVAPRGGVTRVQLGVVTLGVALTLVALALTKRGPGYAERCPSETHSTVSYYAPLLDGDSAYLKGSRHQVTIPNRAGPPERGADAGAGPGPGATVPRDADGRDWCQFCKLVKPPRAGHCRICGVCVLRMDHHCVWINSCVGQANHRSFLLTLFLFLLTSVYGISLVLGSVCPSESLLTALFYCPDVYSHFSSALCFTCAWYSSIVTVGLLHLLLLQLLNISANVTEREARAARADRRPLVDTGASSRGLLGNWTEFLTMSEALETRVPRQADLV